MPMRVVAKWSRDITTCRTQRSITGFERGGLLVRKSKLVGKTPRIRKNERHRLETIVTYCGCLPCLLIGHLDRQTSVEHVTEAGRRVGKLSEQHEYTIGLCLWHHFGRCDPGCQRQRMIGELGPSLAHGRKHFEEFFNDEVTVLLPTQNFMLELFYKEPWQEYQVPGKIAQDVRNFWIDLNHAHQGTRR